MAFRVDGGIDGWMDEQKVALKLGWLPGFKPERMDGSVHLYRLAWFFALVDSAYKLPLLI